MEWNVKNAISRDVERQHLNKILKEIKAAVDSATSTAITQEQVRQVVTTVTGGMGGGGSSTPTTVKVVLQGDVTGTGTGASTITIDTQVDPSILGIQDAPVDSNVYWRTGGTWQPVPGALTSLSFVSGNGYTHYNDDVGWEIFTADETAADLGTITLEASNTINVRRAVCVSNGMCYHPDIAVESDALVVMGISTQAGATGSDVRVQVSGRITHASWSWGAGPVYADDEGVLTQTAPSSGWIVRIGHAISSTTIEIGVSLAIIRS